MPQPVLDRLFEPFYSTKETGRGTGLGLATVWHLVTGFGGRISVESKVGTGSVFTILVPIRKVPEDPAGTTEQLPTLRLVDPMRFLLVDDEASIVEIISSLLSRRGHNVSTSDHPGEAISILARSPEDFDAVVVDLNMPGMNGLEFVERARKIPYAGPLIVMTGLVSPEQKRLLEDLGVGVIINKPFALDAFESAVMNAISASR